MMTILKRGQDERAWYDSQDLFKICVISVHNTFSFLKEWVRNAAADEAFDKRSVGTPMDDYGDYLNSFPAKGQ